MVIQKLKTDEKEFLLSKYLSLGYSQKQSENKLKKTMKLIVISTVTMIII